MTLLAIASSAVGALVFAAAGALGRQLADSWYGSLERAPDGPAAVTVPGWTFALVPACVGAVIGARGERPLHLTLLLVAVLALTVGTATDLRSGMLPDPVTLGPLIALLAFAASQREWSPWVGAAFVALPFAVVATLSRGRGMGWGDVKLAAFGGALVGMSGITLAVALATISACLVAVRSGRTRRPIAFGPYLAVSIAAVLGFGDAF